MQKIETELFIVEGPISCIALNDRLKQVHDKTLQVHLEGYHCSETIIRGVWPFVLPDRPLTDDILKMVMPFRGGMAATMSSHCGGLTLGILVIGALYGRASLDGDGKLASAISRKYWQIFLDEFGTTQCTLLRQGEPTPEAPTRCGGIMVRSAVLIVSLIDFIEAQQPSLEEIYAWKVDRSKEPCHEKVVPMKSSDEE